jgi:hypothetical protein
MVRLYRLLDVNGRPAGEDARVALEDLEVVRIQRAQTEAVSIVSELHEIMVLVHNAALVGDVRSHELLRRLQTRPF